MDGLLLARLQFAATTIYHFFFVPLTLGLSIMVAIMQTRWLRSGDEADKRMTKFWGKLFLINFAMGVVTGIVQEFQFGMNWSEYSRYVGDIFGAPLAIEALLAFFLESTFIGVWVFGWDKLPKKVHTAAIWLAAIGANISALWILLANSFMQEPVGYVINEAAGRAEMVDFFALLKNPTLWVAFPHTFFAGLTTAGFFVMGISAYHLLRKQNVDVFKRSFQIAAVIGLIAAALVGLTGHQQAQHMVTTQPMKMAAAEMLYESEDPAGLSILTIGGEDPIIDLRVPGALSFLSYNRFDGLVQGINPLQEELTATYGPDDYVPPVGLMYWSFRIMVFAGTAMVGLAALGLFLLRKKDFALPNWLGKVFLLAIALPYLANTFGWIMTEVGRMPWTVYGILKLEQSVSNNVGTGALWLSLIGYVVLYGVLMAADVYLLTKFAKAGPNDEIHETGQAAEPLIAPGMD
ncbi:MAG: cytochrome ubiquinol oxidase subunit I [Anaerolineales bacterium]|nr:cytochrome ubiquinol oxidase subunit I [Anaerolineales bacterium]